MSETIKKLAQVQNVKFVVGGYYRGDGGDMDFDECVVLRAPFRNEEGMTSDSDYRKPESYVEPVDVYLNQLVSDGWTLRPGMSEAYQDADYVGIAVFPPKGSDLADLNPRGLLKRIQQD